MRTYDGLELHVRVEGPDDAPLTVVLSHCWTADHDAWRYQVRDLRAAFGHTIRILTYDHRGHGSSETAPREAATIENLSRDLSDVIDRYAPRGDLVLAGHSIGGMTLMELAASRRELFAERVRGVCLVATSGGDLRKVTLGLPDLGEWSKDLIPHVLAYRAKRLSKRRRLAAPVIESVVVRRFLFGETMRLRDHMLAVEALINTPAESMTGYFEDLMRHDRLEHLGPVLTGIPTIVLAGDQDALTPLDHARRLAAAIPGARLLISPGAGHMLPLERDQHVSAALEELVAGALAAQVPASPAELTATTRHP